MNVIILIRILKKLLFIRNYLKLVLDWYGIILKKYTYKLYNG